MEDRMKNIEKKHYKTIRDLYKENGVGRSIKQRLAFWRKREGDFYIPHNPTEAQIVAICEEVYLFQLFPSDFAAC